MLDNGCELSDEKIAKNVSSEIMLLTLNLFVSLLLTQLHSFSFHSFILLQQKLQKYNSNLKCNTKRSLKLEETKKAENNKLRAQGVDIDANLRPDVVEAIALRLVERIKLIVEDGEMLYVLTSQSLRIDKESFASVTGRGNGARLITDVNGGSVTGTILKSNYGWECKENTTRKPTLHSWLDDAR
jgi:hypothetical protein